nr:MAG TPA_asm: hypothetical protein [Caudoviricetes sp.]
MKFAHKDNYYIPLYQKIALSLTTLIYIVKNKKIHHKKEESASRIPLLL